MGESRKPAVGRFSWRDASALGVAAVKHGWAPMLLIQILAGALVGAYYWSPSLRDALTGLERLKEHGGPLFDLLAGAIAGGLIPQIAKLVTGKARFSRAFFGDTLFNAFVYAIVALQVDYFYQLQGALFGNGIDIATLIKKNVVDMFLFAPLISIPTAVLLFEWRKARVSGRPLSERLGPLFVRSKIMPAMIPCWAFWIPMLFCVYSMPRNLQFPLAQLAEASWAVLFIFIATDETAQIH